MLASPVEIRRVRDLSVFDLGAFSVVVACDSSGGIGPKDADTYAAPAAVVAHFAVRVALLELLAAGATPVLVVDALCVEADPTGREMIAAARALLAQIGLANESALLGSTEDNVATRSTGIGVTAIGIAGRDALHAGSSRRGDVVVCLGAPISAPEHDVYPDHPHMVSIDEVRRVRALEGVHDVLPVGSHGVRFEIDELATSAGLEPELVPSEVDLIRSAGPASCVVVSCIPEAGPALEALRSDLPVAAVAHLRTPRA
jgi:selenophosphate synthetase-related protein